MPSCKRLIPGHGLVFFAGQRCPRCSGEVDRIAKGGADLVDAGLSVRAEEAWARGNTERGMVLSGIVAAVGRSRAREINQATPSRKPDYAGPRSARMTPNRRYGGLGWRKET